MRPPRRVVFAAIPMLTLAGLAVAYSIASTDGKGPYNVKPSPRPEDEIRRDLRHLDGDLYFPLAQPTADRSLTAEQLTRHGAFRLVPSEFAGELPLEWTVDIDPGAPSTHDETVRTSPLFLDLGSLVPHGYALLDLDTGTGGLNSSVRQVFMGSAGRTIEITRNRLTRLPVDMHVDIYEVGDQGLYRVERSSIRGHEALTMRPTSDGVEGADLVAISFIQDGFGYRALGLGGVDFETSLGVAELVSDLAATAGSQE